MQPAMIRIIIIAKAITPNLVIKLFSATAEAGRLIFSVIIFLSKDDKLIMPSIIFEKKLTLAGSYTFASKLISKII